jgi:alpha-N-arabinofuranosidase
VEQKLVAKGTNRTSRLQIKTNKKGVVWLDQVSLMPEDTYKVCYIILLVFIVNTIKAYKKLV